MISCEETKYLPIKFIELDDNTLINIFEIAAFRYGGYKNSEITSVLLKNGEEIIFEKDAAKKTYDILKSELKKLNADSR